MSNGESQNSKFHEFCEVCYSGCERLVSDGELKDGQALNHIFDFLQREYVSRDFREEICKLEEKICEAIEKESEDTSFDWVIMIPGMLLEKKNIPDADNDEKDYQIVWSRIAARLAENNITRGDVVVYRIVNIISDILIKSDFPNGFSDKDVMLFRSFLNRFRAKGKWKDELIHLFISAKILDDNKGQELWRDQKVSQLKLMDTIVFDSTKPHPQLKGWGKKFSGEEGVGEWVVDQITVSTEEIGFTRNPEFSPPDGHLLEHPDIEPDDEEDKGQIEEWILNTIQDEGGFALLSRLGYLWLQDDLSKRFDGDPLSMVLRREERLPLLAYCKKLEYERKLRLLNPTTFGSESVRLLTESDIDEPDGEVRQGSTEGWIRGWNIPHEVGHLAAILASLSNYLEVTPRTKWDSSEMSSLRILLGDPKIRELAIGTRDIRDFDFKFKSLNSNWRNSAWFLSSRITSEIRTASWLLDNSRSGGWHWRHNGDGTEIRVDPSALFESLADFIEKRAAEKGDIDIRKVSDFLKNTKTALRKVFGKSYEKPIFTVNSGSIAPESDLRAAQEIEFSKEIEERRKRVEERKSRLKEQAITELLTGEYVVKSENLKRIELSNKIGPLLNKKRLMLDYLGVLLENPDLDSFEHFKRLLIEQHRTHTPTSRSRIPRVAVSDRYVWDRRSENPELKPRELMRAILGDFMEEPDIEKWMGAEDGS